MATTNFYIGPPDGWVQVAANVTFIRISGYPNSHPYYIWYGSAIPTAGTDQVGVIQSGDDAFWVNATATGTFWVKVPNPTPNTKALDGKLRLDVLTV